MIINLFIEFVNKILNLEIVGFKIWVVLIEITFIMIIYYIIKAIRK